MPPKDIPVRSMEAHYRVYRSATDGEPIEGRSDLRLIDPEHGAVDMEAHGVSLSAQLRDAVENPIGKDAISLAVQLKQEGGSRAAAPKYVCECQGSCRRNIDIEPQTKNAV
jgi:hypothetical protein